MLKLENLSKYYPSKLGKQYVFRNLDFSFPSERSIALIGPNGAGKSTMFRMLAKSEYPNKGRIVSNLNISWPIALKTAMHQKQEESHSICGLSPPPNKCRGMRKASTRV